MLKKFKRMLGNKEVKQIMIIRTDLKMGKGKIAGQVAHAAVEGYIKTKNKEPDIINEWRMQGQKKVVAKVQTEKELIELFETAKREKIPSALIKDAGRTQIQSGSITCVAIGPWFAEEIDKITGDLKLL